jgi:ABC-type Fe3+-siderophore transport system permease subunit
MARALRVVLAGSAGLAGAVAGMVLAAVLYREMRTPTGCDDVIHPGRNLSCALPTAPWWLLLGAAILGGSTALAVTVGLAMCERRRRPNRTAVRRACR